MKIGNLDISSIKVGSADCKVYLGDVKLYPTTFPGKWLATYTGGTTSSAECGSSSAITNGEITKANLVSVEIGDCVTSIGQRAFQSCTGLTGITIPDSVTSIGSGMCSGCTSLTSVTIGNGVTSIGGKAFYNCSGLTSVTIPSSVTSIGTSVFQNCSSLTSVTIPDSVTTIDSSAFNGCSSLTSITIPDSVTSISNSAFYNCSSLTSVTVNATTPPTLGTNVFANTNNNLIIYVPASSVSAYQTAWSTYASRIQAIPT